MTMLISDEYRRLNRELHERGVGYGANGSIWAAAVADVAAKLGAMTVLDYGCGQGTLRDKLRRISAVQVANYDPAVPDFSELPKQADVVVITDVMEHIEPFCLHDVLRHIQELSNKGVFFNIACREAKKTLADGRNAHLIVRQPYFWLDTLREYFDIVAFQATETQVTIVGRRLGAIWS